MQEQINEKISLLVDDELNKEQALTLLKTLQTNDELKAKLQRYQFAREVLKNERSLFLDHRFADTIHQKILKEPYYLLPAKKSSWNWRDAGWAVAASLLLITFMNITKVDKQNASFHPVPVASNNLQQLNRQDVMNARFNDYLKAHDNAVYVNNVEHMQTRGRLAGYQPQE